MVAQWVVQMIEELVGWMVVELVPQMAEMSAQSMVDLTAVSKDILMVARSVGRRAENSAES